MFESIKNGLYRALTWSGLPIPTMNFIFPIILKLGIDAADCNHTVTDDGGATMRTTLYKGKLFPPFGESKIANIRSYDIRDDDVILCGYPKTGCHWVYEILQMLVNKRIGLSKYGKELGGMIDGMPQIVIDSLASPRVLNSHLLYEDLPDQAKEKKTKIVLTVRSPKDTLVSYYNHHRNLLDFYRYDGTFDNHFKLFMSGQMDYGSYLDSMLDWDKVMKAETDHPILVVEYEKLKANPLSVARDIAKFLEVSASDEFLENVLEACQFNTMKEQRKGDAIAANLFRKGKVGDWRNWMTDAQVAEIDQVWKERMQGCFYQPRL